MNRTLEESSTNNLIPSWKIEYEQAIAAGISPEELINRLEDSLRLAECNLVCENQELENMESVEASAKASIDYNQRLAYIQGKIDFECRKTM